MCKSRRFLIATCSKIGLFEIGDASLGMDQQNQQDFSEVPPLMRAAAFSVHVFTALGAGVALIALLEAVREHWAAMFWWLGVALLIDAVDGPIARRLDVVRVQPNWSGEVLDLVVDFVTYVFVPAYAITASGLLLPVAAPLLGVAIAVTGALYFADRRMKSADNHFRGFPGLWNIAAFYLFLLHLPPALVEPGGCHSDRADLRSFPRPPSGARRATALADTVADRRLERCLSWSRWPTISRPARP